MSSSLLTRIWGSFCIYCTLADATGLGADETQPGIGGAEVRTVADGLPARQDSIAGVQQSDSSTQGTVQYINTS
jgi:hypothetical protein